MKHSGVSVEFLSDVISCLGGCVLFHFVEDRKRK